MPGSGDDQPRFEAGHAGPGSSGPAGGEDAAARPVGRDLSADLVEIAAAWPELPEAVRAGIVAMVRTCRPGERS